jgi:hypothetical protein
MMAEVVLGLASSHTPQLSTSAAFWREHAARDQRNTRLLGPDGGYHTYAELLAAAGPALDGELQATVWQDKFDRAQAAVEALARRLAQAEPDVVLIIGDDQHELFGAEGIPAIGLFTGEALWDLPPGAERLAQAEPDVVLIIGDDQHELFGAEGIPAIGLFTGEALWDLPPGAERLALIPPDIRAASWAAHADAPDSYPVAAELSKHLGCRHSARSDGTDADPRTEDRAAATLTGLP